MNTVDKIWAIDIFVLFFLFFLEERKQRKQFAWKIKANLMGKKTKKNITKFLLLNLPRKWLRLGQYSGKNQCNRHLIRGMTKSTKWLCAQRKLRSAQASAQSDQSSLFAWRKIGSLPTQQVHSEDSDQNGRMPRLIWVFSGCTVTLLVLSCCRISFFVHIRTLYPIQK